MGYASHAYKLVYTCLVAFTRKGQKKKITSGLGAERGWEQEKEQLISTDLIEAHLNGEEIRAKQVLIKHADNISDAILAKQKVA